MGLVTVADDNRTINELFLKIQTRSESTISIFNERKIKTAT